MIQCTGILFLTFSRTSVDNVCVCSMSVGLLYGYISANSRETPPTWPLSNLVECLTDICDNVIDILDADGYAHQIGADTGRLQLGLVQLSVSG